jgi:hypothetical protein
MMGVVSYGNMLGKLTLLKGGLTLLQKGESADPRTKMSETPQKGIAVFIADITKAAYCIIKMPKPVIAL